MGGEIPSGSVIITPDDMWKTIGDIRDTGLRTERAVAELALSVNPALATIRQDVDANARSEKEHHESHDQRIRSLEEQSWSSRWVPAIVMAVLCSVIAGVIVYALTHLNP